MNARETEAAIVREVEQWPGVAASFDNGGKHARAVLAFGEATRFVVFPSTGSDVRGIRNTLTDVRRELLAMGAVRNERARSTREKGEPNPGAEMRELPLSEPAPVKADPWEALQGLPRAMLVKPGAYPGISAEDYHRNPDLLPAPSLSSSGAKTLLGRSPFHFWFDSPLNPERPPEPDKPHFNVGKAAHDMLLLSDRWPEQYFVLHEDFNGNATKAQADWHAERDAARDAGKTILKHEEAETVRAVADAIQRNPLAVATLTNGVTEETLVWQDPETGVWLRARPDFRPHSLLENREPRIVSDLKFVAPTNATRSGFGRAVHQFGYHQSAAFYSDGIKAVFGRYPTHWLHVVVEKEAPWCVALYELPADDIERGRWLNREAIRTFARCLDSGKWPGYADVPVPVGLPVYAKKQIDDLGSDFGAWSAAA